jgi:hypothetical protein
LDNDDPPTVQFSASTYNVAENGVAATITVTLSAPSGREVRVDYLSSDGTALAADDYRAVNDTLIFSPTETSLSFSVVITDDKYPEGDETVNLTLQNQTNANLGTDQAELIIADNDRLPPSCGSDYPPGEPNIGQPDGVFARVACADAIIISLPTPITATGAIDTDYELVFYEALGDPTPLTGTIYLDLVRISIGNNPASTDENDWYDVFEWGDGVDDTNTNLMRSSPVYTDAGITSDNAVIQSPPLVGPSPYFSGIEIDVDNSPMEGVPPGNYRYVRIYSPNLGAGDGPEVDSIEVLP